MRLLSDQDSISISVVSSLCKEGPHDGVSVPAKKRDSGLWLLHGLFARGDSWEQFVRPPRDYVRSTVGISLKSRLTKRACDIVGSVGLLIMLLPLCVLVAIFIKLDTSGPIFFRHHRIGRNGKHFLLWKFRSMRTDASRYGVSPQSSADIRLTRVGRLIRRLSIDELPQLINVLHGEMSLVGPRPEMPFIVDQYSSLQRQRLTARPGITGLWQISPARALPIHENLQYDLYYIGNQNTLLDCAILLRTVAAVVRGVGAV